MTRTRTYERAALAALAIGWAFGLAVALAGCSSGEKKSADAGPTYDQLYGRGQYAAAYDEAAKVGNSLSGKDKQHAALVAGLSAYALNRNPEAEKWLRPLLTSSDAQVSGEAAATLGLILQEQGRHAQAGEMLAGAANKLAGDHGARAAMYAGDSYRALGQREQAERMYTTAKEKAEQDTALKVMINNRLAGAIPPPRSAARVAPALPSKGSTAMGSPTTRGGAFTVQVGAFSTAALAQKEADKFRRYGSSQVTPIASRGGKTLYAVRIGSFATKADAEQLRRTVGSNARVVANGS